MEPISTVIESKFDNPECRSLTEDSNRLNYSYIPSKGWLNHQTMLDYVRSSRPAMAVHSDGFLSFGGSPGFECSCGFVAMILNDGKCPKCGNRVT